MQYPRDGGVSAIRYALSHPRDLLARMAANALTVRHSDAGRLICQCGMDQLWTPIVTRHWALLCCGCNGSSLPLYIGPPPDLDESRATTVRCG